MLIDDPVKRVYNMTMAFGLDARVPFLDHELIELAASMPAEAQTTHKSQPYGKFMIEPPRGRYIE
jgi:asparagine synthase (glutamine-hydrolysing)